MRENIFTQTQDYLKRFDTRSHCPSSCDDCKLNVPLFEMVLNIVTDSNDEAYVCEHKNITICKAFGYINNRIQEYPYKN